MKLDLYGFFLWFALMMLLALASMGCAEDERALPESIIPEEVQPFYDAFFEEAEIRGVYLERIPVEIVIIEGLNFDGDPVDGLAYQSEGRIELNSNLFYAPTGFSFTLASHDKDTKIEYVIFHELGHFQLDRDHYNKEDEEKAPVSMMHEKKRGYTLKNDPLRNLYLDELFTLL